MDFITIIALIVASMLKYSAPLIFTSIGGTFSERGGIVNVGLEGIMVIGAFAGVLFNLTFAESFGNATPWIAAIVAGLIGVLYSLLHAVATINFRADHVVSGTVLNLIAPSLAVFLTRVIYGAGQTPAISHTFKPVSFQILDHIPFLGKVFFTNVSLVAYVAILVSVASWWLIFKTRFGLRLRSVGEHPQAADTLGINVYRMRYYGVMISGFLGGVGGAVGGFLLGTVRGFLGRVRRAIGRAVYAQSIANNFAVTTIAGPGFIALAAMIFGRWSPIGAMLSSLFFGLSQSLAIIGKQLPLISHVPNVYLQIAPYILTIIVLAAFFGKAVAPKADGVNYIKSK